jgi:hypothetical protein
LWHAVIGRGGKAQAATSSITREVTMNTTMSEDSLFNKQYQSHLKCLKTESKARLAVNALVNSLDIR